MADEVRNPTQPPWGWKDATLSGTPVLCRRYVGGTPYYCKAYPTIDGVNSYRYSLKAYPVHDGSGTLSEKPVLIPWTEDTLADATLSGTPIVRSDIQFGRVFYSKWYPTAT
jgi:hypothetical protein